MSILRVLSYNEVILRKVFSTKVKTNTYTFKMHTKTKCHKQNSKGKHV